MIPKGKDGNLKAMGENLSPGNFSGRQPPVSVSDESVVRFQYSINLSGIISQ